MFRYKKNRWKVGYIFKTKPMKLETKQNEVILVAESDVDKFYLDNFFNVNKRMWVQKELEFGTEYVFRVILTKEKPE